MSHSAARRTYSAEELLALRRSASDEPALAIQNKTREIKGMLFLVSTQQYAAKPSVVTLGFLEISWSHLHLYPIMSQT